ncbi:MAG: hypothetical protein LBH30_00890 [Prevotellaceae bacterium]|jgi:hypothetical protein|nr:hypothetical protein [Prevotellaceae bacterium]
MKKIILLIGCLSLLTVGIISVSCSKDDEWEGCKCTLYYEDGDTDTNDITAQDLEGSGIKSCAELEDFIIDEYDEDVRCVNL